MKVSLKEIYWESLDWIILAEDRERWWAVCENGNDPQRAMKCRNSCSS
jgi:hypothetical protein